MDIAVQYHSPRHKCHSVFLSCKTGTARIIPISSVNMKATGKQTYITHTFGMIDSSYKRNSCKTNTEEWMYENDLHCNTDQHSNAAVNKMHQICLKYLRNSNTSALQTLYQMNQKGYEATGNLNYSKCNSSVDHDMHINTTLRVWSY